MAKGVAISCIFCHMLYPLCHVLYPPVLVSNQFYGELFSFFNVHEPDMRSLFIGITKQGHLAEIKCIHI